MSPLLRSWNEVRTWNIWADECLGVWTPWVVWECEDWNSSDGNSLLRRSLWTQEAISLSYVYHQETTCFQRQKSKWVFLWAGSSSHKKGMQRGNMAQEKYSGQQDVEVECSVPTAHYAGALSRWMPDSGNIWFLSHIDSLERIVRRAWRQRNKRKGQERESQEAVHKFPKILPEALNRW